MIFILIFWCFLWKMFRKLKWKCVNFPTNYTQFNNFKKYKIVYKYNDT